MASKNVQTTKSTNTTTTKDNNPNELKIPELENMTKINMQTLEEMIISINNLKASMNRLSSSSALIVDAATAKILKSNKEILGKLNDLGGTNESDSSSHVLDALSAQSGSIRDVISEIEKLEGSISDIYAELNVTSTNIPTILKVLDVMSAETKLQMQTIMAQINSLNKAVIELNKKEVSTDPDISQNKKSKIKDKYNLKDYISKYDIKKYGKIAAIVSSIILGVSIINLRKR